MSRLIDAGKSCGRWLRRPVVWLPLLAWAGDAGSISYDAYSAKSKHHDAVYVAGLQSTGEPIRLAAAMTPIWHRSGRVIVTRWQGQNAWRIESWDLTGLTAEWTLPPDALGWPPSVRISPDGRRVLVARAINGDAHQPVWRNMLLGWLRISSPQWYLEAFLLDAEGLTEIDHWYMPSDQYVGEDGIQFTADGNCIIVFGAATVEYWPIPPRSWFRSAFWSGGIILVLLAPAVIWRFWRRRKPATIAAAGPPTTPA